MNSKHLLHALEREPSIYRVMKFEQAENVAACIGYNADDRKALSDDSIIYVYPNSQRAGDSTNGRSQAA